MLWHQTRVEDATIAAILDQPQVWTAGSWHAQFDMADNVEELGIGHAIEQVLAFRPRLEALVGYSAAVREQTITCLDTMTEDDLHRDITIPGRGSAAARDYLTGLTMDHTQHTGQVAYLRGYLGGKGWLAV